MKLTTRKKSFKMKHVMAKSTAVFLMLFSLEALADNQALGTIAANIYKNFGDLTQLITACSYIAGLGFAIGAIMKFKMHKDNPTQVPIGTPISLVFIAAALLFLPSILNVTGATIFGSSGGSVAGPSGIIYS